MTIESDIKTQDAHLIETDIQAAPLTSSKKLTNDIMSSVAAGITIAYTFFPCEAYKKYLQDGSHGKFYPYRGSLIFATNIVPTTTIQVTTNGFLQSYMQKDASDLQKLGASFYCGVQGAMFSTVVENCILKQQREKIKPTTALSNMLKVGLLRPWKSYPMIATRDGIFTAYMLYAGRASDEYAQKHYSKNMSYVINGGIGLIGTAVSHPFDSIATHMQGTDKKLGLKQAVAEMIATKGYQGFYKGFVPRFFMFTAFANIIPLVKDAFNDYLVNPKTQKTVSEYARGVRTLFMPPAAKNAALHTLNNDQPKNYIDLRGFKA